MNDETANKKAAQNEARRRIIKRLVAGGGVVATSHLVPEKWSEPVIQSIVLPAHALTSPPENPPVNPPVNVVVNVSAVLGPDRIDV